MPISQRTTPVSGSSSTTSSTGNPEEAFEHSMPHTDTKEPENGTMGTQMREKAQDMVAGVEKLGTQASEVAAEYYQQGRHQVEEWEEVLKAQLREKPLQSLAIAGGIGLLLGFLLRRS